MSNLKYVITGLVLGLVIAGGGVYLYMNARPEGAKQAPAGSKDGEAKDKKILYWQAPMDPTYIRDEPGKSPMGMDLVPVYEGEEPSAEGLVKIDPVVVQNIGVRTKRVEKVELARTIRTVGRVDYDEKRVYKLHAKLDGWVEKLYFDFTGQEVEKDDILLEFYSPRLVSAQEEFLLAREFDPEIKAAGRTSMLELARRRLELWDVPEHQIRELGETGEIMRTLHIHSPASGIVVEKPVVEGMYVNPGTNLYTIADISKVWVYADIYEYEMPWVEKGQSARVTLPAQPGEVLKGRVSFIYPFMEAETRTMKVRLEFENPGLKLKPDMYVNVELEASVDGAVIAVPKEAVLLSGERSLVVLSLGEGRFMPREVVLGTETDDHYQVLEGLDEGEAVVTSAHFLIDSEARLKEAVQKMLEPGPDEGREMDMEGMDMEKGMDHSGMEGMDMEKGMDMEDGGMDGHGGMNMDMEGDTRDMGGGEKKMDMKEMDHTGADMDGMDMEKKMDHSDTDGGASADGNNHEDSHAH